MDTNGKSNYISFSSKSIWGDFVAGETDRAWFIPRCKSQILLVFHHADCYNKPNVYPGPDRVFAAYYVTRDGMYVAYTGGSRNEKIRHTDAVGRAQRYGKYLIACWDSFPSGGSSQSFVCLDMNTGETNGSCFSSACDFKVKGSYVFAGPVK